MSNNDNAAKGEQSEVVSMKGMTFDKMLANASQKIQQGATKIFQEKFSTKVKELATAESVVKNIKKELEKMFVEHTEGL